LEAVVSFFAAGAVWDMSPIEMGIFEGRAAIRVALKTWWDTFPEIVSELDDVLEVGEHTTRVLRRVRRNEELVLDPIGLHECRHTYASFLMAAGYTLRELMEYMGTARRRPPSAT
jgi:integrase